MRNYVLVHGGFHGGWCWTRVAECLRAAGHRVHTPTLTGLGERAHLLSPTVGLSTHIQDVLGVIRWERLDDVVLCGHSYGGMVVTGVADAEPARIGSLVYADAFVPESGQSLLDLLGPDRSAAMVANAVEHGDGWRVRPPSASGYDIADAADRAWVEGLLTPHPLRSCTEPLELIRPAPKRRVFICATGYHRSDFREFAARVRPTPQWVVHDVACGHDLMVDAPDRVAEILLAEAG